MSSARENLLATYERLYPKPVEKPAPREVSANTWDNDPKWITSDVGWKSSHIVDDYILEKVRESVGKEATKPNYWQDLEPIRNKLEELDKVSKRKYMNDKAFFTESYSYPYDLY